MKCTSPSDYDERFHALDALLYQRRHLWQVRPFHHRSLPWRHSEPELCAALETLTEAQLAALESDPMQRAAWLRPWLGDAVDALVALATLPCLPPRPLTPPPRLDLGVPGRKWAQIIAFAAQLPDDGRVLLEWCAGKGHLGRLLAVAQQRSVTSLEIDPTLCAQGRRLAERWQASIRFCTTDALLASAAAYLPANGHAVALHACGELHVALMHYWLQGRSERLTLSPCCYDAITGETYVPLSRGARASGLRLGRADLQFTQQETVTGSKGTRRNRQQELLWRLAFDEWQRANRGVDIYLPVPNVPKRCLSGTFGAFVHRTATLKGLQVEQSFKDQAWLYRGANRRNLVRRMELVSHVFQRPLEVWLALDRTLLLKEHGAEVRLGTFCERSITPRNVLIDAWWPQHV